VLWIHKGELRADGAAKEVINDYVKWTKQPGSIAVGAASTPRAPQRSDAPSTSPAVAHGAAPAAAVQTKPITATSHTEPAAAAVKARPAPGSAVASQTAEPAPRKNSRRVARRERYRRTIREGTRREIIALATTASAILLAIGAGAGIAVVSLLP
jgi:hypothetical protein